MSGFLSGLVPLEDVAASKPLVCIASTCRRCSKAFPGSC